MEADGGEADRAGTAVLTTVAVYRRSVAASLERVWENVRDWEHLPWLHRSSFSSIECEDEGEWGWRARVGLRSDPAAPEFRIELLIDPDAARYVTRTLDGAAAGSEIWTRLGASAPRRTDIEVEFRLPNVRPESTRALGAAYETLYATLWDEDESMMVERQNALDAMAERSGAGGAVVLGSRSEVLSRLPFCVEARGRRFRLIEHAGEIVAFATTCPHRLGPLEDARVEDGCVECPWHGYRFDVRSGRSADGRGLRLPPAPRIRGDDVLELGFDE